MDALVARHARAHGVPESLVHRIIVRESRYDPRVISRGNYGLMQIRLGTARGMGFSGPVSALLDPDVNMTYAVPYLANAWVTARGNPDLAVRYYAGGWYFAAKRAGLLGRMRTARSQPLDGSRAHTPVAEGVRPAETIQSGAAHAGAAQSDAPNDGGAQRDALGNAPAPELAPRKLARGEIPLPPPVPVEFRPVASEEPVEAAPERPVVDADRP
jgi:hypothetical protein